MPLLEAATLCYRPAGRSRLFVQLMRGGLSVGGALITEDDPSILEDEARMSLVAAPGT